MDDETVQMLQRQITELERRINFLYDRINVPYERDVSRNMQLIDAIQKGEKIEAIKVYRMLTDCDLVTAKNAVEGMWGQYH